MTYYLTMNKTFVIRKIAYHYSDDYLYVHTIGGIEAIFQDEAEARSAFMKLERAALENADLGDIDPLSGCSNEYTERALKFKRYSKRNFERDIVKVDEYGTVYSERGTKLPRGLSDTMLLEIREILGLKFYELSQYVGEPFFYGIWENESDKFLSYGNAPYFYNSFIDALKKLKSQLRNYFMNKTFVGAMDELSDNPAFLQSLINSSDKLSYNEQEQTLSSKYLSEDQAVALNELLKVKGFEIRSLPLAEVQDIDHWTYEEM